MPIGTLIRKIQCQRRDLDQPAAEDRPEDRAEQHRHAEDRHQPAHPGRPGGPGHDRHAERHEHAAAEALQDAEADEHLDRRRRWRTGPSRGEEDDGQDVEPLGAEPVGRPAGQRDDRREREGVGRDRPRDGGVREGLPRALGEHGLEGRQGDVDDGDVEDRHDRAEHDHAGDLEDRPVDLVGVVGQCRSGRSGHDDSGSDGGTWTATTPWPRAARAAFIVAPTTEGSARDLCRRHRFLAPSGPAGGVRQCCLRGCLPSTTCVPATLSCSAWRLSSQSGHRPSSRKTMK